MRVALMCLAIAPQERARNGPIGRLRARVSASPLRLLSFGAALHALALLALVQSGTLPAEPNTALVLGFALLYGPLAMLLLGLLMTRLPQWTRRSELHYGWYGGTHVLALAGVGLLELGLYLGTGWVFAGGVALALSWAVATRGLWWVYVWLRGRERRAAGAVITGLGLGGVGIPLFLAGLLAGQSGWMEASLHWVGWLLWVPVLAGSAFLASARRATACGLRP